ncbi:hypothetical protein MPER_03270 [Moniliophthora perniciosa FA553]|nr:hypothetical protein MPER_03270 [Moniliophthora perniciosa FA553]
MERTWWSEKKKKNADPESNAGGKRSRAQSQALRRLFALDLLPPLWNGNNVNRTSRKGYERTGEQERVRYTDTWSSSTTLLQPLPVRQLTKSPPPSTSPPRQCQHAHLSQRPTNLQETTPGGFSTL